MGKNQEKKSAIFFGNFFRGLSFYSADCTVPLSLLEIDRWIDTIG
jgi:hypothetical protein